MPLIQLSNYIAIPSIRSQSVLIGSQREGRTKDGIDKPATGFNLMLSIAGPKVLLKPLQH